jgi:hypothetical protein
MNNHIVNIRLEIDTIKEYIETELCRKCDEMRQKLETLEITLDEYITSSGQDNDCGS